MLSKVIKWGNSQGIRIPKKILENSNIKESSLTGYVMVEQVKSIDTKRRKIKLIEPALHLKFLDFVRRFE